MILDYPWSQTLYLIGDAFLRLMADYQFWPLLFLVVLLVWSLYRRMLGTKAALYGIRDSALRITAVSAVYGLFGGLVGSYLMIFFGVSINDLGIGYLWLLAIGLMLFSPRFLCFSYAGGLLALISLLTGHPILNIAALMGLVAVLHLVESVLILTSGHFDPLPVYVRTPSGQVVGAFNLQKFWPIPLVVLALAVGVPEEITGELVKTPYWWPLIRPPELTGSRELIFGIFPVLAALGYGELAITCLPRQRVRRSALHLALFSIILLGLAILASHYPQFTVLPVLFSPLAHELVIYLGRREELQGQPRFVPPARGLMVLDVLKGSPAMGAGLRSGDVIHRIGICPVNSRAELFHALAFAGSSFPLIYASGTGKPRQVYAEHEYGTPFGVITVPEPDDSPNVNYMMGSPIKNFLRRFVRR